MSSEDGGAVLEPQAPGIPLPRPSAASIPYWDGARDRELRFQRCGSCGTVPRRPASLCGACGGRDLAWEVSSGRGTLYSWTVVWRPQQPSFHVPYAPAIMSVEEGWWLVTAVVGCTVDALRPGMDLRVVFHPAGDGFWLPYAEAILPGGGT